MVDIHLGWCGPCEVMENNYRSLFFSITDAINRVEFYTASQELLPEDFQAKLQYGPLSCKPRFVLFIEGEKKGEIDGADFTALEAAVNKLLPAQDE